MLVGTDNNCLVDYDLGYIWNYFYVTSLSFWKELPSSFLVISVNFSNEFYKVCFLSSQYKLGLGISKVVCLFLCYIITVNLQQLNAQIGSSKYKLFGITY